MRHIDYFKGKSGAWKVAARRQFSSQKAQVHPSGIEDECSVEEKNLD